MDQGKTAGRPVPGIAEDVWTTKIGVPGLPDWVIARPRLTARIGEGARGPLTVVTGAPGAGKTVAVASWTASIDGAGSTAGAGTPPPVAWVTVDEGDGDPAVFWRYLLEALRGAGVDPPPAGSSPFRVDGIDHVRIAELALGLTRREQPVVLVLDDFRPAVGSSLVTGMAYLLQLARPWLRLVIISRRDLPLPLHRFRLTGDLTEIRADDLAFSARETDQLMAQHGVVLRRKTVRALRDRTEGWAAGLRLAALSMHGHPDPEEFVAQVVSGDHAIAGYLVEEVLDAQPPTVRLMLLNTSILDRVNAEIAAELTPANEGSEFCAVVAQNSFIRPLGHGWYRYHQMFRDVLHVRLRHENPGQAHALHRRAAAWFSAHGLLTEAVQHAAAAQDWQMACTLVVDRLAIADLLGARPACQLGAALRQMPQAAASAAPEPALVAAALALASGDEDGYRSAVARGSELLADRPPNAAAELTVALLRLGHARRHDQSSAGPAAADVEKLLDRVPHELVQREPELRCLALTGRGGIELWTGQWGQAEDSFAAAHTAAVEADSDVLQLDCLAYGALVEAFRGRWARAAELTLQAARLVPALVSPPGPEVPIVAVVQAWIALQRYQLAECRRVLDQADLARLEVSHPLMAAVHGLVSAHLDVAEGYERRALETLHRVRRPRSTPHWLLSRDDLGGGGGARRRGNTGLRLAGSQPGGCWPYPGRRGRAGPGPVVRRSCRGGGAHPSPGADGDGGGAQRRADSGMVAGRAGVLCRRQPRSGAALVGSGVAPR
ncbi:MAG TPA: hypothetical protein VFQ77_15280 [Pseudonocardiaceae bacterium]|jgi:LuxR family maltose regulon positive regulatory protein|nr:hypothetical protein [Pseudonocardiaceae bacterium]